MRDFEINFRLAPLEEIEPWGPEHHLNYYGLSFGCFWIRCGADELFRYTDEILRLWAAEARSVGRRFAPFGAPYDDYQVLRLYVDLNDVLPYALEPVPDDVSELIPLVSELRLDVSPPSTVVRQLSAQRGESPSAWKDLFYRATEWWNQRAMMVFHLRFNPRIRLWRVRDIVRISFDNRGHMCDGAPVWTADHGEIEVPVQDFLAEVQLFEERLVGAMAERLSHVKSHWSRPQVRIDLDEMERNQEEMEVALNRRAASVQTDWVDVRKAIEEIRQLMSEDQ